MKNVANAHETHGRLNKKVGTFLVRKYITKILREDERKGTVNNSPESCRGGPCQGVSYRVASFPEEGEEGELFRSCHWAPLVPFQEGVTCPVFFRCMEKIDKKYASWLERVFSKKGRRMEREYHEDSRVAMSFPGEEEAAGAVPCREGASFL